MNENNPIKTLRRLRRQLSLSWKRWFLRFKSTEHSFVVISAVVIGLASGFSAVGIIFLIRLFQKWFWGSPELAVTYLSTLPWSIKLLVPALGGLVVGFIVYFYSQESKGHGVPEVMAAMVLKNGIIRPRVAIAKMIASALSIGSGGSVGREGPVIQIGAALGSTSGQIFQVNPERLKTFVGCGAAAGIAAAFNAPIAGALFAVEIILGDFAVAQFSPIVISSVVGTVVSRYYLGDHPAFPVPPYELVSPYELFFYALLGLVAGVIALLYIKVLYGTEDIFERLQIPGYVKPALGGLMVGLLGIFVPHIFGVGYGSMQTALSGKMALTTMVLLIFAKIIATSLSLGSGGSGGVFAPSLFIGTMVGGALGSVVHQIFPQFAGPGAYALVGMGALVAGSTHAPITAILIIFEMTNDYKIILPLMFACVIATLVATRLEQASIYTMKLIRRGINLYRGREVNVLRSIPVKEVMRTDPVVIQASTGFQELIHLLINTNYNHFFVTDRNGKLLGSISVDQIRRILEEREYLANLLIAHDLLSAENSVRVFPEDTLDDVIRLFTQHEVDELPVVDPQAPDKIIGVVRYKDVIQAYNREITRRNLLRETQASLAVVEKLHTVPFLDGYAIAEIPVPMSFVGKSLRSLNLRPRYGVNVLLIKRQLPGGEFREIVPRPEEVLQMGDVLIAMGKQKDLRVLQNQ
ncbi:MAG: CBS domain-containing protein [Calditrichaeota bacterium]|nr:MAG: CBS domain-containing protein [Calditrichota bacterium]